MSDELDITIVTGLSGAGRSEAANVLEDLGFFVIDNLPPLLIPKVAELARVPGRPPIRYALGADVRSGALEDLHVALEQLREAGPAPGSSSWRRATTSSSGGTRPAAASIRWRRGSG